MMIADLLTYSILFKSPQEISAAPITRTFDATIHATKPITFVQVSEYFLMPQMTVTIYDVFDFPDKSITVK